jgi:cyanophycin synthetase
VALAAEPDEAPPSQHVACGITGGGDREAVRERMIALGAAPPAALAELSPRELLLDGLRYGRSDTAVILDAEVGDVPERYRDSEFARRLVSVVADAVPSGGIVVCPADDAELQDVVLEARCRLALFSADGEVVGRAARIASAVGELRQGRIVLEMGGITHDAGEPTDNVSPAAQVAAALAARVLAEPTGDRG